MLKVKFKFSVIPIINSVFFNPWAVASFSTHGSSCTRSICRRFSDWEAAIRTIKFAAKIAKLFKVLLAY